MAHGFPTSPKTSKKSVAPNTEGHKMPIKGGKVIAAGQRSNPKGHPMPGMPMKNGGYCG